MDTDQDATEIYRWFVTARIVTAALIGAGIVVFWRLNVFILDLRPVAFAIFPFFLVTNLFWFWVLRIGAPQKWFLYGQLAADAVTITFLIHFAGALHTEFTVFYFLALVPAAIISLGATIGTAALSLALYAAMLYLESIGIILPADAHHFGFQRDETEHIAVFVIIAAGIAFQGYYYIWNIRKKNREVAALKDEFLFRMIHDLRGPVNAIRWMAEKYAQEETPPHPENFKKDIAYTREAAVVALRLLRDLAEITRGQRAETLLIKEWVSITDCIQSVMQEFESDAAARGVMIRYAPASGLPLVFADGKALREIFSNLLDNAIKYNRAGGTVTATHEVKNNFLQTVIADTGAGIKKENLPKLFTPYFREGANAAITGTGMGLYIVKKLVEKMGGAITVDSEYGRGTSVAVSLPVAPHQ